MLSITIPMKPLKGLLSPPKNRLQFYIIVYKILTSLVIYCLRDPTTQVEKDIKISKILKTCGSIISALVLLEKQLSGVINIQNHPSLPSSCPESTRPTYLCFHGTSWENLVMYGGLC